MDADCDHVWPLTKGGVRDDARCTLCGTPIMSGYLLDLEIDEPSSTARDGDT